MKLTKEGIAVVEWDTLLSKQVEAEGCLDVQEARNLIVLIEKYIPEGGVVADVGACIGDHTLVYSELVGPQGEVHAFEPHLDALQCLRHNMKDIQNVTVYDVALGSMMGWATTVVSDTNLGATRVMDNPHGNIRVMRLDHVARGWSRLDFMKIDAEGYEPSILDGARETLMRLRPVMLIEVNEEMLGHQGFKPDDIYLRLIKLGYSFEISPKNSYDLVCKP